MSKRRLTRAAPRRRGASAASRASRAPGGRRRPSRGARRISERRRGRPGSRESARRRWRRGPSRRGTSFGDSPSGAPRPGGCATALSGPRRPRPGAEPETGHEPAEEAGAEEARHRAIGRSRGAGRGTPPPPCSRRRRMHFPGTRQRDAPDRILIGVSSAFVAFRRTSRARKKEPRPEARQEGEETSGGTRQGRPRWPPELGGAGALRPDGGAGAERGAGAAWGGGAERGAGAERSMERGASPRGAGASRE